MKRAIEEVVVVRHCGECIHFEARTATFCNTYGKCIHPNRPKKYACHTTFANSFACDLFGEGVIVG